MVRLLISKPNDREIPDRPVGAIQTKVPLLENNPEEDYNMTLQDFAQNHGLKAIVRRHAVYNKPVLPVDGNMMCALIYSRTIDPSQLGLNAEGSTQMYRQGELLAEMGIVPSRIVTGIDLRNVEGGNYTAAAIKKATGQSVTCHKSPAVTYPYYDANKALTAWQQFGDVATHMYLADRPEVNGLWTESAATFESRITSAIENTNDENGVVLFDLNFEQVTLLHFLHVEKIDRKDIPFGPTAWCPKNGGGIAYGSDGTVMEFNPDFEMIS